MQKPVVLAPAGNWDCARAAVENGADAVYFGVGRFNARTRADNFSPEDLPRLMEFLHRRGVEGRVTFNTLVFPDEMREAESALRAIIAAGVDAAIVQDAGVCRLIREISPDFPIHASTQMSVTSAAGLEFARELGASLVVLARECSVAEIASMRAEFAAAGAAPPAVEVFVHGALCVAYSGQCLTSEALGGRSANRGECAQACRLPYELLCDGAPVPLDGRAHLLSPRDLAGMELLAELTRAGVASLKIEGRLKSPEYVAAVTRAYRAAVDRVWDALAQGDAAADAAARAARREFDYDLEMSFSRGLGTGWLLGTDNKRLVHARYAGKRGVFLGEIEEVAAEGFLLRLRAPLKAGDGVMLDGGGADGEGQGGFVHAVETRPDGLSRVRPDSAAVDLRRVRRGHKLWKTADPALARSLRETFSGDAPRFRRPLRARVSGAPGAPLRVEFEDAAGRVVSCESAVPLAPAASRPLTAETMRAQLGRLGGTPFELDALDTAALEDGLNLSLSELNRLRRELVARLDALRAVPRRWTLLPPRPAVASSPPPSAAGAPLPPPEIIPLVRSRAQLDAALQSGAKTLYCEFEDLREHKTAVARVREFSADTGAPVEVWAVPPRVFKQGEDSLLRQIEESGADGWLVRNHEHLRRRGNGLRRRGDFSLNIANAASAAHFIGRHGLERVTASYDLNAAQLEDLLRSAPPAWFEVTLHQRMPMFHMEHCVFCAFLSPGRDYRDCGRPCSRHTVALRDRAGVAHPLFADAACRNTLHNGRAQTGAEFAARLLALGARRFRVEFLDEDAAAVARVLSRYAALLRGEITGAALWRELRLRSQLGVTRGALAEKNNPRPPLAFAGAFLTSPRS
jgi:putative protease